jgi:hypothetical protein
MQYTKLGFYRLFEGCDSHQMPCILIDNRSVIPNYAYCYRCSQFLHGISQIKNN